MSGPVLNIGDARKALPRLVRQVAQGGRPILIGPRGKPIAVLMDADEHEALVRKAKIGSPSVSGWSALQLEIVGAPDDLAEGLRQVRSDLNRSLEERLGQLAAPAKRVPRREAKRR